MEQKLSRLEQENAILKQRVIELEVVLGSLIV